MNNSRGEPFHRPNYVRNIMNLNLPPERSAPDPFITVIVYENENALRRTLPLFQRLIQEFASETEFKCIWVNFENLTSQSLSDDATRNAIKADIVIFSGQTPELPPHVCEWVESWLPNKNLNDSALVAQFGSTLRTPPPALHYLEMVAARAKMNFLCELPISPAKESANPDWAPASLPHHWGINE